MSRASLDNGARRVSRINTPLILTEPRAVLGWALADLGNGIARLARRLDDSVGTVDDGDDWFKWGWEFGHRAGARQTLDAARLAFEAGKGATA